MASQEGSLLKRFTLGLLATVGFMLACGSAWADEAATATSPPPESKIDSGDTSWMLVSTGLVLLMVPGLALFYGGMVRRKNVLGTMMHSMVALAIIGIEWLLFGYSLAFGDSLGGFIGWKTSYLGLQGVFSSHVFPNTHIPVLVH